MGENNPTQTEQNVSRRKLLAGTTASLGFLSLPMNAAANQGKNLPKENNTRKPDEKINQNRPIFILKEGELRIHPSIKETKDADFEYIENKFNERLEAGLIQVESDGATLDSGNKVVISPSPAVKKNGVKKQSSSGQITPLSHGENYLSGDISTWGTPWNTHEVKLDSELSYEIKQLLEVGAGVQSMLAALATKLPYGAVLAVFALALSTKLYYTQNQIVEHREGHGVQFLLRYAEGCVTFYGFYEYCYSIGGSSNPLDPYFNSYVTFFLSDLESQ